MKDERIAEMACDLLIALKRERDEQQIEQELTNAQKQINKHMDGILTNFRKNINVK
ncbi:MAG TPA: hypothetical protein VLG69_01105 [Candidatus Andersenbacteria bacterium]|nr:hypothetical protein [Candidatus Andersenbacteria bacterium]